MMLHSGNMDKIQKLLSQLTAEIRNLITNCIELSWYSRGAWSYECCLNMSAGERDIAMDFIKKRMEQQTRSLYPIY